MSFSLTLGTSEIPGLRQGDGEKGGNTDSSSAKKF